MLQRPAVNHAAIAEVDCEPLASNGALRWHSKRSEADVAAQTVVIHMELQQQQQRQTCEAHLVGRSAVKLWSHATRAQTSG